MKFSRRILANTSLLIVFSLLSWVVWKFCKTGLAPTDLFTGVSLLGLIVFLALFNARKKLPFLPVFRVSTWMQWHIYLGLFSILLFLLHVDFRVPSGMLEIVLATIFILVSISGIVGLVLSRVLPKLMNQAGEPATYEHIPRLRKEIRDKVRSLVFEAEESCKSSTLPEFYLEHLHGYLEAGPSFLLSFGPEKKRVSHRLANELQARMQYLSDDEKTIAEEIEEWISTKENLDFQEAGQRLFKGWLFAHIPLSMSLILLGTAHGIFALLYGGNG